MQFVLSTKESLKHVGRCCSKVKLLFFFFSSCCLNIVLQPALLPGGSGLSVNAVMRIHNLGSSIQMQEGLFRIILNLVVFFYS